jgi:VIT1/CCC1 family predicted Fe2+/Mn2+ transporter
VRGIDSPGKFPREILWIVGIPFLAMVFTGGVKLAFGWVILFVISCVLGMWIKGYVDEERASGIFQVVLALLSGALLLVAVFLGLLGVVIVFQCMGEVLGIFFNGNGQPPENWRR